MARIVCRYLGLGSAFIVMFTMIYTVILDSETYTNPVYDRTQKDTPHSDKGLDSTQITSSNVTVEDSGDYLVPNIVHYIWYTHKKNNHTEFKFVYLLSMMSAQKILRPDIIYFHTDHAPTGKYWAMASALPSVKVVYRQPPRTLFGEKTKLPVYQSSDSNVDRVKILLEYGGIYLDLDVVVVQPFDALRRFPCTVGYELDNGRVCGGIILASQTSTFLYIWANSYLDDYRVYTWAYNSGVVPSKLATRYPHLVHIEPHRLHRPNWGRAELETIYGPGWFDWRQNYAVHLWYTAFMRDLFNGTEPSIRNVKHWGGAFGELALYILRHE